MRIDEDAVRFAGDFVRSGKPVFAICHAPQLLITADAIRDRQMTGYQSIIQDIKSAGARRYLDQQVAVDKNLVSSRHPGDLPAYIRSALE